MQSLTPLKPSSASGRFYKICAQYLQPVSKRHQSSYRRARSKLNIKPDPDFLPTKTEQHDHVIYNPPPSMPNVYHTPTIFLPKNDRRRQMQIAMGSTGSQLTAGSTTRSRLPPPVRKPYEKRYHLTEKDVLEMRQLRKEDPTKWSVTQLAKKFDCSGLYVQFVTNGLAKEKREQQASLTEAVKSNWGTKRRVAREDRAIRKERWYRDE